jgi:MFS family permease
MHAAQALFFLNAAIWVAFGFASISRILSRSLDQALTAWVIAIFMFGNAAAILLSGIVITRHGRLGYSFALAVLAVNILLTFTDQVGALDLVTVCIDLVLVALLIVGRKGIRQSRKIATP